MTRDEFDKHCRRWIESGYIKGHYFNPHNVSQDDFKIIEYVYTWHPAIDPICGKSQISYLYLSFGINFIWDLWYVAVQYDPNGKEVKEDE